jgi:flagellar M-ring protein FliF
MKQADSAAHYLDSIKSVFQTGTVKQLIFLIGVSISVALGIVLYMSIQEPTYRPLDYQVTQQNMASIVDTLEKAGVQYKVNDRDGVVYVVAKDFQLAKLKLSASGVAKDDSFNYSFLNDQSNFGNSQFIENARYLRALESDLAKTINAIEGVNSARVHIAVPQNTVFADENGKTTASVVISMAPGLSSDKEKIRAIIQIVAGSVPGLDPRNVAITDQYGHYLTAGLNQDSVFNAEQLSYQNNLQTYYEKRIESMITPLLGENKVSVRVYADVDFTQKEEAEEQYDPDKKVLRSEQSSTESTDSSGASGAPGSLSNTPPSGEDAAAKSSGSGGSQSRNQSTKNYEITKSVNYKKSNSAKIKSLSVAVVVDNDMVYDPKTKQNVSKPIPQEKLDKITQLVQATIGYAQDRGDKVTVVNSGFTPVKVEVAPLPTHVWDQLWFWDVLKKTVGMLLGFIFLFVLYRRLSVYFSKDFNSLPRRQKALLDPGLVEIEQEETSQRLVKKQDQINHLKELATTEPAKVASIIKNWVGKP